jgi:opacity protein-like surface antigen
MRGRRLGDAGAGNRHATIAATHRYWRFENACARRAGLASRNRRGVVNLKTKAAGLICLAVCVCSASPAAAQQDKWAYKGFLDVNVGGQPSSHTVEATSVFDIYGEQAAVSSAHRINGGALIDFSAGYLVWDNLTVGAGFSTINDKADVPLAATIPDPIFRNQPRTVNQTATGLAHRENALHLFGKWMMPVAPKIDLGFSFGPSIYFVSHEMPGPYSSANISEPGPTLGQEVNKINKTGIGFNVGVDANYMLTHSLGAGVVFRYTQASVDLEGATDKLTVGGPQLGIGVRYRF